MGYKGRYIQPKQRKSGWRLAILLGALAVFCIFGGVVAKYLQTASLSDYQATADRFYFTLDLLGDTNEEAELSRTVQLYGGGQRTFDFTVQNYFDTQRITSADITYSIAVSGTHGGSVSNAANQTLPGGSQQARTHTLTVPAGFAEGDTAVVTVTSSAPYAKTMTLTLVLHPNAAPVAYYIADTVGSSYATLYLMTGQEKTVNTIVVQLPNAAENALQPDMTNEAVSADNGVTSNNQKYATSFTNAVALKANESRAILLFKAHPERDYSAGTEDSPIAVEAVNGIHTIPIP